jgi:DNA helicase-2/ATP-dependent DNA helicase PcrA
LRDFDWRRPLDFTPDSSTEVDPNANLDDLAISAEELAIIEDEERILTTVRRALEGTNSGSRGARAQRRMASIRDDLGEATAGDRPAIAAEAHRLRSTDAIAQRVQLPDLELPYFAHMQLETERGLRDVLLGQCSFIDTKHRVAIVDWREAPVAQVFFHFEEGEDYEQEYPDRWVEGVLRKRRIVAFDRGELVHIQTPKGSLRKRADGRWARDARGQRTKLEGGEGGDLADCIIGTGLSGEKLPVISSLLDKQQYEALTREAERPLLILGGAGCGKTTVALHRLAYLAHQQPDVYALENLFVIVPEEGLVRLTRSLLEELGMEGVGVSTIDAWFVEQAGKRLPELPTRLAVTTPAVVIRIKRHSAFCALLPMIAQQAGRACARRIDRALRTRDQFSSHYEGSDAEFPLQRLEAALELMLTGRTDAECETIRETAAEEISRFSSPLADRERLLGDRDLLERVVRDAKGEIPTSAVKRVLEHTRLQDSPTAEQQFADVPEHNKRAVDGLSLDKDTPNEDAGSIDVEDFALLLELDRQKSGRPISAHRSLRPYTHLVLDEAQELSEVELLILGQAVATHGSVTVAGDSAQQIGAGTSFESWDKVMGALGRGRAAPVTLETSYRCTAPIVEFGQAVLGPLAPKSAPVPAIDGAPVSRSLLSSDMHAALVLAEALSDLLARETSARVAVIAREEQTAERLYDALHHLLPVRLVLDGRFLFKPGIDITSVAQVKGLEFDYVVIPDASRAAYPADDTSRRLLHVAATRAIHQLWVIANGAWSPLVPGVEAGGGQP